MKSLSKGVSSIFLQGGLFTEEGKGAAYFLANFGNPILLDTTGKLYETLCHRGVGRGSE